ncbi:hypothetical protein BAY60_26980 [Prauserella muralis]|uniref:Uncharacterized protein n=1 Tax=Prauserella muralis TaxID=588067 RepID=A0A2V4AM56_9PSEU|nr:hypothetical protein BAY60_26980 [Prauserella muralis]TWE30200.1 hypothetical protein FHX69_2897 [Prauserella muralis]
MLDPPRLVWIRLRELLRIGPHDLTPGDERHGLRIETEVPGIVREEIPRADAGLLVLVTYPLWTGDGEHQIVVTHWLPAHLVRPRGRTRRDRLGEDRRRKYG